MDKKAFAVMSENKPTPSNIKQEGNKCPQYISAIIVSIGAFVIGTVLAWTSACLKYLRDPGSDAPVHIHRISQENWIAAWTPIGAVFGSVIFGALLSAFVVDLLGRKLTLIVFTVPWIVTWAMLIYALNVKMIYASRFISGGIIGLFCAVLPLYVHEISEDSVRGSLGVFFQIFLVFGILYVYTLSILNSYDALCKACGAVCVLYFIVLLYIPESPTFLVKKNRQSDAETILRWLRGPSYDVNAELQQIHKELESATQKRFSLAVILKPINLKELSIALGLMLGQQLSGINGVIFFAEQIFVDAGAPKPAICTIIMGVVQTLVTVLSSALVDRAGRRILLLISCVGMGVSLTVLGYYFKLQSAKAEIVPSITWLPLICLVTFIVAFSLGIGPLPWLMSGEVLAPEIKSFGSGLAVATNWICVTLVTFFFTPFTIFIGLAFTFWIFAIVSFVMILFVITMVPETKGKSKQQIQSELAGNESTSQPTPAV